MTHLRLIGADSNTRWRRWHLFELGPQLRHGYPRGMLAALAAALSASPAWSDEIDYSLRGFGTLGATYSDQQSADFTGILFQPNGAGHTREVAASVDSKLGLQLDVEINRRWAFITQLVSQYHADASYTPEVEWAYVQYEPTPELSLRAGRIVTAPFMESQTRLVSYTYPWVRPPNELYSMNPITHKTGADIHYQFMAGEMSNSIGISWGTAKEDFSNGANVKVNSLLELEYRLDMGSTSFRLAYTNIDFDLNSRDLAALAAGLETFAQGDEENIGYARDNARLLRNEDGTYQIYTAGFQYQPTSWLLRAEAALVRTDENTFISYADAWYLTVGRNIGTLTPFVTISEISSDRKKAQPLDLSGVSDQQLAIGTQLNQGLNATINSFAFDQRSYSAGLRWDFSPGLALKLQYNHVQTRSGSGNTGRLVNPQPGFEPGDTANIFSLTMDFVF